MSISKALGFTDAQEQSIMDAAKSLATMVRDSGKPVAFSIEKYAELVIGSVFEPAPPDVQHILDNTSTDDLDITSEQMEKIRKHLESMGDQELKIADFVAALDDALCSAEVSDICNCVLAEYGYDQTDHPQFEGAGGDNVFIVFPVTKQTKFLDL